MKKDDKMDVDDDHKQEDEEHEPTAEEREKQLDEEFPDRPKNHSPTLPFHTLFRDLFNPLNDSRQKKAGSTSYGGRKSGPDGNKRNPNSKEARANIIARYVSKWRRDVGNDFYPAFRLIVPDKDRDRAMYGLKEKALGRFLVKILKIDRNSEDASSLLNWKLPGQSKSAAGDFAGRCYEVLSKRAFRVEVGDMTIAEVNDELDELSKLAREDHQLPVLTRFYRQMNAEEMMWLIRIILRDMRIGATEKTLFEVWHPDATALFNVSSSLRRVCWQLYDESIRLEGADRTVSLMQCFQPQLAMFQVSDMKKIVGNMQVVEGDEEFWIEEKLDGERMQLHMFSTDTETGGRQFNFWSRKGKDYTYLYGVGLYREDSALTQHLKSAFHDGVENLILDGEMVTWDPELDLPVAFGTLKTAANLEIDNPYEGKKNRPLFRVFDILYLNGVPLTQYTLRDRRKALEASVANVHRRLEKHTYSVGTTPDDIEKCLREVITRGSEGLVVKNPRSAYHLNARRIDWMKVKPEYMEGQGENLDCLIIGGYYGSGHRGGILSSFLCGLRANESISDDSQSPQKFLSFFKVGGGIPANEYAIIQHFTEGKWIKWDPKRPPTDWIELGGGALQRERPDVWIKPADSIVVEVKAAQITTSDEFATGITLRFQKFVRPRRDKDWRTALTMQGFLDHKAKLEAAQTEKQEKMEVDKRRDKKRKLNSKRQLVVAGYSAKDINGINVADSAAANVQIFAGLTFYVVTESTSPQKKTKPELEGLVKAHGGKIVQTHTTTANISPASSFRSNPDKTTPEVLCIAERRTVKVASLVKRGDVLLIKPIWLFDCIAQAKADSARGISQPRTLVWEPERHLYFTPAEQEGVYDNNVDEFGDAIYRDTSVEELRALMAKMTKPEDNNDSVNQKLREQLFNALAENDDDSAAEMKAWMFKGTTLLFHSMTNTITSTTRDGSDDDHTADTPSSPTSNPPSFLTKGALRTQQARTTALFASAKLSTSIDDKSTTHIVIPPPPTRPSETISTTSTSPEMTQYKSAAKQYRDELTALRKQLSTRKKLPRVVTVEWVEGSWKEGSRLDEERFAP